MKVLIVGAGIGGLTLAAFLRDSLVEYEIIEKQSDWSRKGFLIAMWDSGRDILKKLGLSDRFDSCGTPVRMFSIRNGGGHVLHNYDLTHFYADYGSAVTTLCRADLHAWLVEKAAADKIRMGVSIEKLSQDEHGVEVRFSDGSLGTYDVVVGADGVHSQVRDLVFGEHLESFENWRIWYTWIDSKYRIPATITEYVEPKEFVSVLSTKERTSAWLVAPADHAVWDAANGRVERLKKIFKDESFLIPGALEGLSDADVQPSDLVQVKLRSWSHGRVVLLGDAAHCSGPHAGMGTTLAMEDGYVLAGELIRMSALYPLKKALANYEKKRRMRTHRVETVNRRIKFGTLIESRVFRKAANLAIPYVSERYLLGNLENLLKQEI